MIDKPILELLTFGSNLDVVDFLLKKLNFQAVIKSAASAASLDLQGSPRTTARHADGGARATDRSAPLDLGSLDLGGCASSRLDHGLKFPCFFNDFLAFFVKKAPSGAKYREKGWAVTRIGEGGSTNPFWNF